MEKEDRWEPARGEGLDLRIRCPDGDKSRTVKPEEWVLRSDRDKTSASPELRWVFAGSWAARDGRFAADLEGTVAGLVDFESNLIALSTPHSADNEQLWLIANKERIPPRGTHCQVLVRADHRSPVRVFLRRDGSIRLRERRIEMAALVEKLAAKPDDPRPICLEVCAEEGTIDETRARFLEALRKAGFTGATDALQPSCHDAADGAGRN